MNRKESVAVDTIGHFVNGGPLQGPNRELSDVYDPSTGVVSRRVVLGGMAEVDAAVRAALAAYEPWAETPPASRAQVLFRFRDLLFRHADELSGIITSEHGKVLSDAKGELIRGFEVVEFACGIPHLLKGEHSQQAGRGIDVWSTREPLGIVAGITPFNFPAMIPLWLFPVAIACGNAFILKPSERDPSASLRLAELLKEAGLPDGIFNVVQGGKDAVDAILSHDEIAAVSFVGSTTVAEYIFRTAAAAGKRVQALGGAKNHMVIMPDADLDRSVDALMGAAFGSAGERCMAISVAVAVGESTADAVVERLRHRISRLKVGCGLSPSSEMGPLVTRQHLDRVLGYVETGIQEGAELVVDGRWPSNQEDGFFMGGCLFDHVTPGMKIYKEEIFGPVLAVVRVPTLDDALALINSHEYGNGVALFTRDGEMARLFAHRVKVGMVGINVPIPVPASFHSFGGWKRSLFGDTGVYGMEGIKFYTRLKTVTSRWPSDHRQKADFAMPTTGS